jgi:hypothetical protein
MRGMSSRITGENCITIYKPLSGPDIDGGPQYLPSPTPTISNASCSVQYTDTGEIVEGPEGLQRVSMVNWYKVFVDFNPQASPRWIGYWREGSVTHTLIIAANPPSEAGRGSTFVLRAHEYL